MHSFNTPVNAARIKDFREDDIIKEHSFLKVA